MSEDNQNRNQGDRQNQGQNQNQGENWQGDQQGSDGIAREGRGTGSESQQNQPGSNPSASPELDDMDGEDREDDLREDGSPNRRHNIG